MMEKKSLNVGDLDPNRTVKVNLLHGQVAALEVDTKIGEQRVDRLG